MYTGMVTAPFIEEVLQLTLHVDGRQMRQPQLYHVNFHFQMDQP